MSQLKSLFSHWGITAKLVAVFLIFGLVPMGVVGYMGYSATSQMKESVGEGFKGTAMTIADKIDRNLFQRYGDVQAFGLNRIVGEKYNWYQVGEDNEISQTMNQYVKTYGLYSLTMLVDTEGSVIAVNNKDADGNPIETDALYKKNYAETPWFKALQAEDYTTGMPFAAPGNDKVTGTYVQDLYVDEEVKALYSGDDGLTISFSAPVYADGNLIGYWNNRAKFSLVEEIVQDAYKDLKSAGFPRAELTLLDGQGRVIVDYDPTRTGTEDIVHDLDNVLMKLNLAEKGVAVAQGAVAGKTGYENALHARKQIWQLGGYAHLRGAMGFPGMNWSVLVRVPETEAVAGALAFQRNLLMVVLICLGVILPLGWWIGRRGAKQVKVVQDAADKMAGGDYAARVTTHSQDEIGQLGGAFNKMADDIQSNIVQQEAAAQEMAQANTAMARIKAGLDAASTNVLICDRSYTIIYQNKKSYDTLKKMEGALRQFLPSFSADAIVGSNIDQYHKNPGHQRGLLDDPKNLPYRREIHLGDLTLDLNAAAIMSDDGEYLGNVVEWADITVEKKAQDGIQDMIQAAGVGDLQKRMAIDGFDGAWKAIAEGCNAMFDAIAKPLQDTQRVARAIAEGDLTQPVTETYQGEYQKIKEALNQAIDNLTQIVTSVREGADSVALASEEITKGNEDLSQRTSGQASALEETSASMEEMTSTIKQNADNAKQANQLAVAAREVAEKGGAVTVKAVEAMNEINKSSKKIADIINVIDEIAFQTNLLALNAAVEAARAGEQGRGFAVVASEVRNLAQRSATAAKEIKGLINESVQKVSDGSDLVNESGQTLGEIVNSVKRVTDIIGEISAASQEQASGIDQVNKAVMQMDQTTQQNAALVEETTSASQSMQQQAAELIQQVGVFKMADGQASSTTAAPAKGQAKAAAPPATKPKSGCPAPAKSQSAQKACPEPVGVGSSNGHDRRQSDDDFFEEF